ncbi:MAG: thioesterase family protein [Clostridia bacterium]|nr:thioesterase family protein [Clostridia bacterium]
MPQIGTKLTKTELVTESNTAAKLGSGMLPVYATPAMILLIESTAAESVAPQLEEGSTTVGTKLEIEHVSATPTGLEVRCETELVEVDRRRLVFDVKVYDKAGLIGCGKHERFIVASEKFMAKAESKR